MFLLMGVNNKQKELNFNQTTVCDICGSYGRLEGFMTYNQFSLFLIPLIKWKKEYFIKTSCCDSIYKVDNDLGKEIELGRKTSLNVDKLKLIHSNYKKKNTCKNCNNIVQSNHLYCPYCGKEL